MESKILVSLVSDQTLPNVELIKEFELVDEYIFIHTDKTIKQLSWIIAATKIVESNYKTIQVDPFDVSNIESKLNDFKFKDAEYIVNITGGTKLMILVVMEYFKKLGAKIYYITGHKKNYVKVFLVLGKRDFILKSKLSLDEYLTAYGFTYKENTTFKTLEMAEKLFKLFVSDKIASYRATFELIRLNRGKKLTIGSEELIALLQEIDYSVSDLFLSKYDTKYLSGDWFEEYIYFKIKTELHLDESEIATGLNLIKENTPNEIDVIFIFDHKLYIIECKTSIIDKRKIMRIMDGILVEEEKNIKLLPEILYKSDALRNKFGLFANTMLLTLEELRNDDDTPMDDYKSHFDRAVMSNVSIFSKKDLVSEMEIGKLIKIH